MFDARDLGLTARSPRLALAALALVTLGIEPARAADLEPLQAPFEVPTPPCGLGISIALASSQRLEPAAQSSKSVAILGGQPSALDLIRLSQQAGEVALDAPRDELAAVEVQPPVSLAPAAGGMRLEATGCEPALARPRTTALTGDDFLASKRLTIGRTAFDSDWQRVSHDRISGNRYRRLLGGARSDPLATLNSVNSWVNQRIAYTEDRDLFARADFWAGATRTLKLRRGDCEDIALTKMQLLAAAGIPREDMILTIARDLVRNADHAVLIVRHDGRYFMLDNASDEVFDASGSHDYRPVLSFGNNETWLHGY